MDDLITDTEKKLIEENANLKKECDQYKSCLIAYQRLQVESNEQYFVSAKIALDKRIADVLENFDEIKQLEPRIVLLLEVLRASKLFLNSSLYRVDIEVAIENYHKEFA